MESRQPIFLSVAAVGLLFLLAFIVFGDKGLVDLHYLKQERDRLQVANRELVLENHTLYQEKVRLEKKDPALIEYVVRKELGFVGPEEFILISPSQREGSSEVSGGPSKPGEEP